MLVGLGNCYKCTRMHTPTHSYRVGGAYLLDVNVDDWFGGHGHVRVSSIPSLLSGGSTVDAHRKNSLWGYSECHSTIHVLICKQK